MEKTACPSSYVVVDLETTGLYPSQDRILEIGAVKVLDGEVADTFCMFADPQMKIPEKIRELTGITQEMVAGQPTPAEAGDTSVCMEKGTGIWTINASMSFGFSV